MLVLSVSIIIDKHRMRDLFISYQNWQMAGGTKNSASGRLYRLIFCASDIFRKGVISVRASLNVCLYTFAS